MNRMFSVARITFLRLRRDKIFLPAAAVGSLAIIMSGVASYWGVEEFFKILFDLSSFVFQMVGVSVAIFWGVKLINDSKQEGSIELELSSPIGRSEWILGKFLGLAAALILLALSLMLAWQLVFWGYGMGMTTLKALQIFASLTLGWLVMGALAISLASLSSQGVALFASLWCLILGLVTGPIYQSLAPDTPKFMQESIAFVAGIWDLHRFDLSALGPQMTQTIPWSKLQDPLAYGLGLVAFFLATACLVFQRRQLNA